MLSQTGGGGSLLQSACMGGVALAAQPCPEQYTFQVKLDSWLYACLPKGKVVSCCQVLCGFQLFFSYLHNSSPSSYDHVSVGRPRVSCATAEGLRSKPLSPSQRSLLLSFTLIVTHGAVSSPARRRRTVNGLIR